MIKRALIAALLSVGCDVLDLRSAALPVARHYIKRSGAAGAMSVRKLPGNSRVSLIEMFDSQGSYLTRSMERKVESLFFREDYNRTDPDDLGIIEISSRAVEEYQADFVWLLPQKPNPRKLRMVCDYGYSAVAGMFPTMLAGMGVEAISLNSVNDAKLAPRTPEEVKKHIDNLRHIVHTLGYDMGVLFTEEGERLTVIDDAGNLLAGNDLFAAFCTLIAKTHPHPSIAMSVTAPSRLEDELKLMGVTVIRTKADTRSLMNTALESGVVFAGDDHGGFIFPEMHPGFDAIFGTGKLISLLREVDLPLSEVTRSLPSFQMAYEQVRCPYESKGKVMREVSQENRNGQKVELLDGIKIFYDSSWVLILPDSVEPLFHVYAEAQERFASEELAHEYARKIEHYATVH